MDPKNSLKYLDLRKYNVSDIEEAIELLSVIEAKAPQIVEVLKKSSRSLNSAKRNADIWKAKVKEMETQGVQIPQEINQEGVAAETIAASEEDIKQNRIDQLKEANEGTAKEEADEKQDSQEELKEKIEDIIEDAAEEIIEEVAPETVTPTEA